ncbi:MAG: hypothetical protein R3B90_09990 [Planctomycetaceae bacterium]
MPVHFSSVLSPLRMFSIAIYLAWGVSLNAQSTTTQRPGRSSVAARADYSRPTGSVRGAPIQFRGMMTDGSGDGRAGLPTSGASQFDARTLTLIDVELRDATPGERAEWLKLLASVEQDQVPHLLNARRRAISTAGQTAVDSTTRDRSDSGSGVTHAANDSIADTLQPQPADPGQTRPVDYQYRSTTTTADSYREPLPATEPPRLAPPSQPPAAQDDPAADRTQRLAPFRRNWMNPLRPLRGDGTGPAESAEPPAAGLAEVRTAEAPPVSGSKNVRTSAYMTVELQRVITLLRTEIEETRLEQSDVSGADQRQRELQLRLLHLLADEPALALQALPNLSLAEQEAWTKLIWSLSTELNTRDSLTQNERLSQVVELVSEAERRFREAAPLEVPIACFCHSINSFGNYDRFPQDVFRSGQPVLLYVELRNFLSGLTSEGLYRTRMRTTVEIVGTQMAPDGTALERTIDRREFAATEDLCRSPRRDYYHSYRLDLPWQLEPGRYQLRLNIVDELGGKAASYEIPFAVQ